MSFTVPHLNGSNMPRLVIGKRHLIDGEVENAFSFFEQCLLSLACF